MQLKYRFQATGHEPTGASVVLIHGMIQFMDEDDPESAWANMQMGHRDVQLEGQAVLDVLQSAGTPAQKAQSFAKMIRDHTESWGLDVSDDASQHLVVFVEDQFSGYPVSVPLRT